MVQNNEKNEACFAELGTKCLTYNFFRMTFSKKEDFSIILTIIFTHKMFVLTDTRTCEDCKDILEELEKVMTSFSEFHNWF